MVGYSDSNRRGSFCGPKHLPLVSDIVESWVICMVDCGNHVAEDFSNRNQHYAIGYLHSGSDNRTKLVVTNLPLDNEYLLCYHTNILTKTELTMTTENFAQPLTDYMNQIKTNYVDWSTRAKISGAPDPVQDKVRKEMIVKFCNGVRVTQGSKYFKVVHGSTVHSFIVRRDHGNFKAGDILKANTWRAPATNFARGNILTGDFNHIQWTGA
jgi:hypothetical protein